MFKIGDKVIYTPNIENLPPPHIRIRDHGIIVNIDNYYIHIKFNIGQTTHKILPAGISHLNNYNDIMNEIIKNIPFSCQLWKAKKLLKLKLEKL